MTPPTVCSFPPIAREDARILILGSMPGIVSLQAGQYYAHPRNQFWSIIAALLQTGPLTDYATKVAALHTHALALWDVMQSCQRSGSLDSQIDRHSVVVNDFEAFLRIHPHITRIYFNGATAEQAFCQRVLPTLVRQGLTLQRLPSTSPANALLNLQQKLQSWRVIVDNL